MYLLNLLRMGLRERGSAREQTTELRSFATSRTGSINCFVLVTLNYYQERGSYDVTRVVLLHFSSHEWHFKSTCSLSPSRRLIEHLIVAFACDLPFDSTVTFTFMCQARHTYFFHTHHAIEFLFLSSSNSSHFKCRVSNWQCSTKSLIDPLVTHTPSAEERGKKVYRKYELLLFTLP